MNGLTAGAYNRAYRKILYRKSCTGNPHTTAMGAKFKTMCVAEGLFIWAPNKGVTCTQLQQKLYSADKLAHLCTHLTRQREEI